MDLIKGGRSCFVWRSLISVGTISGQWLGEVARKVDTWFNHFYGEYNKLIAKKIQTLLNYTTTMLYHFIHQFGKVFLINYISNI